MASNNLDTLDAIVLRITKYGDTGIIANVYSLEDGLRGVIAKGALRSKSKLGVRLEPFRSVQIQLAPSRSDLAIVKHVGVVDSYPHLEASWKAQQHGAIALDLVAKVGIEYSENSSLYYLLSNFLVQLNQAASLVAQQDSALLTLLVGFELKVLYLLGISPQLHRCVLCGKEEELVAFSLTDGGVVCRLCKNTSHTALKENIIHAANALLVESLDKLRMQEPPFLLNDLRRVEELFVRQTLQEHADVKLRQF